MARGAGGTNGGAGRFFIGLIMMVSGGYLFFNSVKITYGFHMGYRLYSFGGFRLTSGMVLVPLVFGVGMIFYNAKNYIGWGLSIASLVMLFFGIITSVNFRIANMSAFDLITIIVLMVGGIGLFLSSLKDF